MTPELRYKINRCAELLAESPLDDEVKKGVLESLETMTVGDLDRLVESLERETLELEHLSELLKKFDEKQNRNWEETTKEQKQIAEKRAQEIIKEIELQVAEGIKESLKKKAA